MKAAVFHKPKDIRYEEVPDLVIQDPTDIILKVTSTAICGSDLHIYNGLFPQPGKLILGHEFMGIVHEVGEGVKRLSKGDRVLIPFPIACGQCWFCKRMIPSACESSNPKHYGPEGGLMSEKGGGLYGYTDLYGGYNGGQAEYVRVAYADYNARKVPDGMQDEEVLFLTDIFPTGWTAIDWSGIKGGETVAVFGCGPVGIMAQKSAWLRGAGRVLGVDIQDYRLEAAAACGRAEPIHGDDETVVEAIRKATDGRGADICVDAVGMEADRNVLEKISAVIHVRRGTIKALTNAISAVRRGGFVSVVGVYGTSYDNFLLGQIFDKGLKMATGQAPVQQYVDELLTMVREGKVRLDDIISHRLPLSEVADAYEMFNKKTNRCLKVVLKP